MLRHFTTPQPVGERLHSFTSIKRLLLSVTECRTYAVDSGTYEGSISKVNPAEQEIYVEMDGGQKLELYFTSETTLTQKGETVAFEQLEAGQQVSVEVTHVGNRVDPVSVEILGQ